MDHSNDNDVAEVIGDEVNKIGVLVNHRSVKRKQPEVENEPGYETDKEEFLPDDEKHSNQLSKVRRKKKSSEADRKRALENNEWISSVKKTRVKCKGCHSWIVLQRDRRFEGKSWKTHREKCGQIVGVKIKRIQLEQPKTSKPVSTI